MIFENDLWFGTNILLKVYFGFVLHSLIQVKELFVFHLRNYTSAKNGSFTDKASFLGQDGGVQEVIYN